MIEGDIMIFFFFNNNNPLFLAVTFLFVLLLALFEAKAFIFDQKIKEHQSRFYTASVAISVVYFFAVIISNDWAYTGIILFFFRYFVVLTAYTIITWKNHPFYKSLFSLMVIYILIGSINYVVYILYVLLFG